MGEEGEEERGRECAKVAVAMHDIVISGTPEAPQLRRRFSPRYKGMIHLQRLGELLNTHHVYDPLMHGTPRAGNNADKPAMGGKSGWLLGGWRARGKRDGEGGSGSGGGDGEGCLCFNKTHHPRRTVPNFGSTLIRASC